MPDPIIEMELYLVRHAESMGNAGLTDALEEELKNDPPLTPKGCRQAQLLGEYCSSLALDHLFCSGMRRALQTAEAVRSRQPENGAGIAEVHKVFTECNTGEDCRGRTIGEIQKDFPFMQAADGTDPSERIIFHGKEDSDAVLLQRAKQAIAYLRGRFCNGEKVMVTAHAAFNTFLLFAALGLSHEQKFDPSFYNTGITKIVFYKTGTARFADVYLEYMNSVAHLCNEFPSFKF